MPNNETPNNEPFMRRAILLAEQGVGRVEPNPLVGAVLVDESTGEIVGEGFHEQFGGAHAEINAIQNAGDRANNATLFVTLEPCCHHGKTGPCTAAILSAGIHRVVIGVTDPFPTVNGGGIAELQAAGIDVEIGLLGDEAEQLIAPFTKRQQTGLPWVHAKWAMTLDGKIASCSGQSQWISSPASRERTHQLRGCMDAIIVGAKTAVFDDPQLTARPKGPRVATRIIVDSFATLPLDSQLVQTANEVPVIVATTAAADAEQLRQLESHGVELLVLPPSDSELSAPSAVNLPALLEELGRREMTHLLVEGGGELLGSFFDHELVDELLLFIAPKIVGGRDAVTPVAGLGKLEIPQQSDLINPTIETLENDIVIHGRLRKPKSV